MTPQFAVKELEDMGFALVIFSVTTFAATVEACFSILEELKEKSTAMGRIEKIGKISGI